MDYSRLPVLFRYTMHNLEIFTIMFLTHGSPMITRLRSTATKINYTVYNFTIDNGRIFYERISFILTQRILIHIAVVNYKMDIGNRRCFKFFKLFSTFIYRFRT